MSTSTSVPTRRLRVAGLVALASLGLYVLIGLPFLVLPEQDPIPDHVDVVLVLGPPTVERVALAERLVATGRAGTALISMTRGAYYPGTPDAARWSECIAGRVAHEICFAADPFTTQGEARELGRLAERYGWRSAVVTTQTAHLTRARMIVGRCFSGSIVMRASGEAPSGGWVYQYVYQTAATLKAWFVTNGC